MQQMQQMQQGAVKQPQGLLLPPDTAAIAAMSQAATLQAQMTVARTQQQQPGQPGSMQSAHQAVLAPHIQETAWRHIHEHLQQQAAVTAVMPTSSAAANVVSAVPSMFALPVLGEGSEAASPRAYMPVVDRPAVDAAWPPDNTTVPPRAGLKRSGAHFLHPDTIGPASTDAKPGVELTLTTDLPPKKKANLGLPDRI
jgi:hypothetical protein